MGKIKDRHKSYFAIWLEKKAVGQKDCEREENNRRLLILELNEWYQSGFISFDEYERLMEIAKE